MDLNSHVPERELSVAVKSAQQYSQAFFQQMEENSVLSMTA